MQRVKLLLQCHTQQVTKVKGRRQYCDSNSSPFSTMSWPTFYVRKTVVYTLWSCGLKWHKTNSVLSYERKSFFKFFSSSYQLVVCYEPVNKLGTSASLLGILSVLSFCFHLFLFNVTQKHERTTTSLVSSHNPGIIQELKRYFILFILYWMLQIYYTRDPLILQKQAPFWSSGNKVFKRVLPRGSSWSLSTHFKYSLCTVPYWVFIMQQKLTVGEKGEGGSTQSKAKQNKGSKS